MLYLNQRDKASRSRRSTFRPCSSIKAAYKLRTLTDDANTKLRYFYSPAAGSRRHTTMSSSGTTSNTDSLSSSEESGSVGFLSPNFDALKALNTPGLQPPVHDVQPMDNISKCRAILPSELPESLVHKLGTVAPASKVQWHLHFPCACNDGAAYDALHVGCSTGVHCSFMEQREKPLLGCRPQ